MKVTVITPVFNGANTITDCIASVSQQDYNNIEHIIIDGGSTDGTLDIIRRHNIKHVSEQDAGIYDAFNKGISLASGDIIHILNSDDMYANHEVVKIMVQHMAEFNLDLCHGYAEQINANDKVIKRIGKDLTKIELLSKMRISHPSTFIKKQVYLRHGGYSVGFRVAADYELLLRVWDEIETGFLPVVTTKMRLGGVSNSNVELSYRESFAAALIHGATPVAAISRYYFELLKSVIPGVQPTSS